MESRNERDYRSLRGALVLLVALATVLGAAASGQTMAQTLDPQKIVNVSGRRPPNAVPGVIYTVPAGKILVIRGVTVATADEFTGPRAAEYNLRCGATILIPREVMRNSFDGLSPLEMDNLGWVCGAEQTLSLDGPPEPNTVGWSIVGELVDVAP